MVISIEEIPHKLLLIAGSLVHNLDSDSSPFILVHWQAVLDKVMAGVLSVDGGQPLISLSIHAAPFLYFLQKGNKDLDIIKYGMCYLCTLEENHVSSKDLGNWVPIQSFLRPGLGDIVAVIVSGDHHLSPDRVRSSKSFGQINLVPEVLVI